MWTAGSPTQPCGGVKRNAVRFSGHLVRVLEFSVEVFSSKKFWHASCNSVDHVRTQRFIRCCGMEPLQFQSQIQSTSILIRLLGE